MLQPGETGGVALARINGGAMELTIESADTMNGICETGYDHLTRAEGEWTTYKSVGCLRLERTEGHYRARIPFAPGIRRKMPVCQEARRGDRSVKSVAVPFFFAGRHFFKH